MNIALAADMAKYTKYSLTQSIAMKRGVDPFVKVTNRLIKHIIYQYAHTQIPLK